MAAPTPEAKREAAEGRMIAVVMVLAAVLYVGTEALGSYMNWPPKFIFLADLSAAAAFIWTMIASYRLWRKRKA